MIPAFPFFPFGKKGIKILYRSAGNRIPVAGLFHITFFDMNIAHESKSNKTPLYLIGELIGVPNTVMDSALHELKDRIDKDPKYKCRTFVEKVFFMENKEDYVGYEDQELCNRYYKEAEAMRQKQDWSRLRAVPAPAKGTPSPGWGQLGRGNEVRVKYVSINSGLGGDRL